MANSPDDWTSRLQEIVSRTYVATSPDGLVSAAAGGDETLHEVIVGSAAAEDAGAYHLSRAATVASRDAVEIARRETAVAMANLPGMNPQLRQLLMGDPL